MVRWLGLSRPTNKKSMAKVEHFEDLEVWRLARKLTGKIYSISRAGAFAKDFGFRDQICRAAVSIVSNIAEGFERQSSSQFAQFLDVANGSAGEVRAQLYIALDLGYIGEIQFTEAYNDVVSIGKMLTSLKRHLRSTKPLNHPTTPLPHHPTTQPQNHPTT